MKFLLPSSEGIIKHGPSYLQRGYYPFTVLIVPEEVTSHRSVFMSQKGLLKSEAPDGFMRKDLVRQGSCHFTSCTWGLGRSWPDMALIFPFCFLSIHVYPPISRGQHQQQATRPGEELGERGHRHPLHQTVTSEGELSSPGSPSAGEQRESQKKGKATGDKQTQERATPCVGMWTLSRGYENTSKAITCQ